MPLLRVFGKRWLTDSLVVSYIEHISNYSNHTEDCSRQCN